MYPKILLTYYKGSRDDDGGGDGGDDDDDDDNDDDNNNNNNKRPIQFMKREMSQYCGIKQYTQTEKLQQIA
jgi:hypothetical protein